MDYEDDLLAGLLQSGSSYCFPLILSLSKDARSSYQWCDKLTMRGLGTTLQLSCQMDRNA